MRRTPALVLASLVALAAFAPAATADADTDYVFAGGGTPLSNGAFFPGTAVCDGGGCTVIGSPVQIEKGTNFTFVMADAEAIANAHQIVSVKRNKRTKRPLFMSDVLTTPGDQDVVITSKLKPGSYEYRCPIHFGMYGVIEIVTE